MKNQSDADGEAALSLLRMAGIETKNVKYIQPGTAEEGYLNIDTGKKNSVVASLEEQTAYFDHHSTESVNDTSATEITYNSLVGLGLLEKNQALDRAVKLITQEDNRSFPNEEKYFEKQWHRTMLGLARFASFDAVVKYFEKHSSPTEILSPNEIESLGLEEASKKLQERVKGSLRAVEKLKKSGNVLTTEDYGEVLVDIGKKVDLGFLAAKAKGLGGYVIWSPESESFFISTKKPLKVKFGQGEKIRETMWIKSPLESTPINISLSDILSALNNGNVDDLPEGLRRAVQREELAKAS